MKKITEYLGGIVLLSTTYLAIVYIGLVFATFICSLPNFSFDPAAFRQQLFSMFASNGGFNAYTVPIVAALIIGNGIFISLTKAQRPPSQVVLPLSLLSMLTTSIIFIIAMSRVY